jgi:glycosyltransferase involved in cell wall biosynthesis
VIPLISIVVPAYHASKFIRDAVKQKLLVLESLKIPFELIVVLDGMDKASKGEIAQFLKMKQLKVVYLKNNHGKGFAVRRGMSQAKGKYIGYMDVDNDIDPQVIKDMYEVIIKDEFSAVIPTKMHPLSKINYPVKRKLFSKTYNFVVKHIFKLSCSDTQLGAKLYSKSLVMNVLPLCAVNGFAFELEMLMYAKKLGLLSYQEIPVVVNYKTKSTISMRNGLNVLSDTFKLFLRIKKFEPSQKENKKNI